MRTPLLLLATLATAVSAAAIAVPAAASAATHAAAPAAARHTARVVVRPVHADGTPVAGWRVTKEKISGFTCNDGASPVAVDKNIRFCGYSATYTVACWKSAHHTALCLRDPKTKKLARIRYTGRFRPVAAPKHPSPQEMKLYRGGTCLIRDGGAWSHVTGHPKWVGDYSCTNGTSVYGPGRDGINRSHQPWTVHEVRDAGFKHQRIAERQIRTAYFVGTAS